MDHASLASSKDEKPTHDVFISYARPDQGFARDLNSALGRSKFKTWIDLRGISPSAQWHAEIFTAIEAADNFIFVISPDSIGSTVCAEELAHAERHKKCIIPILYHQVDRNNLFPSIGQIQWINYPELGFQGTFRQVKGAIRADLPWKRLQTQISQRAARWEEASRDAAFLLRGTELREAIRWLERSQATATTVSELHKDYIRVSDEWEAGEIQRLTSLTQEKELQRRAAEENLSRALEQERISLSRHLAAESEIARREPELLERSVLLGIEALKRKQIPEAETALRNALLFLPKWAAIISDSDSIRVIRFSADSRYLAIGTEPAGMLTGAIPTSIRIFQVDGFKEVGCVPHLGFVKDVVFSPDSTLLAAIGAEQCCRMIRVQNATVLGSISLPCRQGAVAFSPNGKLLVLCGDDGTVKAFYTSTLKQRWTQSVGSQLWRAVFSPDGEYLSVSGQDGHCRFLLADTGHILFDEAADQHSGAFSNSGKVFATGSLNGVLSLRESGTWKVLGVRQQDNAVADIVFTPDDRYLITSSTDGMIRVFDQNLRLASWFYSGQQELVTDLASSPNNRFVGFAGGNWTRVLQVDTGREVFRTSHDGMVRTISFSPDGRYLAAGGRDRKVRVFQSAEETETVSFEYLGRPSSRATFSPRRNLIVTAVDRGPLFMFDAASKTELFRHQPEGTATDVSITPDESVLVFADDARKAVCGYDIERRQEKWIYTDASQAMQGLALSPNSEYVIAVGWRNVTLLDAFTGKPLWQANAGQVPFSAAFGSASRVLATCGADARSYLFDCPSGELIRSIDYAASGTAIAFNDDDSLLASARGDGTIWISSMATGETVGRIANVGVVLSLAWQGNLIATAGKDRSARIFDSVTGAQIWRIDLQSAVLKISLAPGLISTTEHANVLRTHHLALDVLLKTACSRVTRNLTEVEWRRYFGDEPYRETCPSHS